MRCWIKSLLVLALALLLGVGHRIAGGTEPAELKDLREHPDIEDVPPPPESANWMLPVLAIVPVLAVIVAAGILLRRRTARSAKNKTPEQIALHELDRLGAMDLPGKGRIEEFHTLLANVVRRFLEKKYELPARRQTTQEFFAGLEKAPLPRPEQQEFLKTFLHQCDLAKFAGARVSPEECLDLWRQTREFLTTPTATPA